VAEGVCRAEYGGIPCQVRPDYFHSDHGIVDLKTCDDLTWFEADARRYSYLHQVAFYRAVLRAASGSTFPVHIVAVEKKEPFRVGVWLVAESALDFADAENAAAIERLKDCLATGTWPSGYETVRVFDCV
jgi:exodeoxyribonuclease VIII